MANRIRDNKKLHTGFEDHLVPLKPLDLNACTTVSDLVDAMKSTAFAGRQVGEAADVLYAMVTDKQCFVVLTLSGAMTIAKMGLVICDMIELGMVNAIVSTGALMAHGFNESRGQAHFKYNPRMSDVELFEKGYDRVYDSLELEKSLEDTGKIVAEVLHQIPLHEIMSSYKFHTLLGKWLAENTQGRGILKSAYLKKVPVYVPAFTDSELGIDIGVHNRKRAMEGKKVLTFDMFDDLTHFTDTMAKQKRMGIFTIGGGVPRNWAQQLGPYLEFMEHHLGIKNAFKRYQYAVRICPEPVHYGGLSGATYSEGVSWGKFVPAEEGGKHVEVLDDATVAWPLIVKAVMERLKHKQVKKDLPR